MSVTKKDRGVISQTTTIGVTDRTVDIEVAVVAKMRVEIDGDHGAHAHVRAREVDVIHVSNARPIRQLSNKS
jgi:hypothetical protein